MISAVLSAAIALSGAPSGSEGSAPRNDVAIVLVGARDVRAINPTACDRVLVVGDLEGGPLAVALLPAGSDATYPLPLGLAPSVYIELATVGPAGLERTGAIPIGLASGPLVVTAGPDHACSFAAAAVPALQAPEAAFGGGSTAASTGACTCTSAFALMHVPVVVPAEDVGPSRPPELDDEPLPVL